MLFAQLNIDYFSFLTLQYKNRKHTSIKQFGGPMCVKNTAHKGPHCAFDYLKKQRGPQTK